MPIEEQEPAAAAAAQREGSAEQHAAIAAEHERHLADVEHRPDSIGECDAVGGNLWRVEHAALRIANPGSGRGRNDRGDARVKCPRQTVPE
ncbi:MAG TPA: hypothetical protein VFI54_14175 [Solirubrobacteraceae bacterium]|nr:hypothetical protein [Solirubrobacteraceae bacterium]